MTDQPNRYGNEPLGKSVEEVEQDSGNAANSPAEGETVRHDQDSTLVVPAVVNSNTSGVPAVLNPTALVEDGGGADDGRGRENRDSSEQ